MGLALCLNTKHQGLPGLTYYCRPVLKLWKPVVGHCPRVSDNGRRIMRPFPKFPNLQLACRVSRAFLSTTPSALTSTDHRSYHVEAIMPTIPAGKSLTMRPNFSHNLTPSRFLDWNAREDFFSFTRGRFVVDEADQMARRHIRFDMNKLTVLQLSQWERKPALLLKSVPMACITRLLS